MASGWIRFPKRPGWRNASRFAPGLMVLIWLSGSLRAPCQTKPGAASVRKAPASPAAAAQSSKPSLDLLVLRANAYWNLLAQGKKLQAMEYVESSCRDYFAQRPFPQFSAPRVTKLEPAVSGNEVDVTVTVKRRMPPLPAEMNYPVLNHWSFVRGNWWVIVKEERLTLFNSAGIPTGETIAPEELEQRKSYIRSHLQFRSDQIDFGTVRKGAWAQFEIIYRWTGDQPVEARLQSSSLDVEGFPEGKLMPASEGRIQLRTLTSNFDGEMHEAFSLLVNRAGVSVPYGFKLQGLVYTPLSVIPQVLRFREGESEKDLEIVNNSKTEVTLDSLFSNTAGFEIQPLPQRLRPGDRCTLRVKQAIRDATKNYSEEIAIKLAAPVEDMSHILLPIVLNYQEQKRKSFGDLSAKEIEELIKAAPPANPIKP